MSFWKRVARLRRDDTPAEPRGLTESPVLAFPGGRPGTAYAEPTPCHHHYGRGAAAAASSARKKGKRPARHPVSTCYPVSEAGSSSGYDSQAELAWAEMTSHPRHMPPLAPDEAYVHAVLKKLDTLYADYAGQLALSSTWCFCCSANRNPSPPAVCSSNALSDLGARLHASAFLLQHANPGTIMLSFLRAVGADMTEGLRNPGIWLVPRLAMLAILMRSLLGAWEARAARLLPGSAAGTVAHAMRATRRYVVRAVAERAGGAAGAAHPLAIFAAAAFQSPQHGGSVATRALVQYAAAVRTWYEGDSSTLEQHGAQGRLGLALAACGRVADARHAALAAVRSMRASVAVVEEPARVHALAWLHCFLASVHIGAGDLARAEAAFMASMLHSRDFYVSAAENDDDDAEADGDGGRAGMDKSKDTVQTNSAEPGRVVCHGGSRGVVLLFYHRRAWQRCETSSRLAASTYAALFGRRDVRTLEMVYLLGDCLRRQGKEAEAAALLRKWGSDFENAR